MSDVSTNLYKSQLLDYYYQRRAESSINKGSRFLISKAVFGTSSLVTKKGDGTYEIGELPKAFDLEELTSQFCTINLVPTYSGGIITVRMDLDQSQLQEGKNYPFNTLVVLDNENKPIAIICVQEDSLYVGKTYTAVMAINSTTA
ncbi:TPA: phage tail protein [Escherichia coli]|nr:phage tail protein [Escherichia coli]HBC1253922.1 phage tail protein [Escherichia coli]HBC1518354.1 phage tail protein [Escherichia coli]